MGRAARSSAPTVSGAHGPLVMPVVRQGWVRANRLDGLPKVGGTWRSARPAAPREGGLEKRHIYEVVRCMKPAVSGARRGHYQAYREVSPSSTVYPTTPLDPALKHAVRTRSSAAATDRARIVRALRTRSSLDRRAPAVNAHGTIVPAGRSGADDPPPGSRARQGMVNSPPSTARLPHRAAISPG